ncbi:MAG: DUF4230 domain-containing protein [Bacteroidota bacterium]
MAEIIIALLGGIIGMGGYHFLFKKKESKDIEAEATVLLDRVQSVCKLVTTESEFSEIIDHKEKSSTFFNLIPQEKKAILIVKAKVLMGFDLSKAHFDMNTDNKSLTISHLPEAEVLSIEPDVKYYDISKSMLSKFTVEDYSKLNKTAVETIRKVIEDHNIPQKTVREGMEMLKVIKEITSALGWTCTISSSHRLQEKSTKQIES